MTVNISFAPKDVETAFRELHCEWVSHDGLWIIVGKVESLETLPKYKVRTVKVYKKNWYTGVWYEAKRQNVAPYVGRKLESVIKMVMEF